MTILYDVVSLLRVFPSIGANLEPYSKKENGEKAITSAPNRVLRTGRRIKFVRKHVPALFHWRSKASLGLGRMVLTIVRWETSLCVLIHHQNREMLMMPACRNVPVWVPHLGKGGSTARVELRGKTRTRVVPDSVVISV